MLGLAFIIEVSDICDLNSIVLEIGIPTTQPVCKDKCINS